MVVLLLHWMKLGVTVAVAWTVVAAVAVTVAVEADLEMEILHQCAEPFGHMDDHVLHSAECAHVQTVPSLQTGVAADTCIAWMEWGQSVYQH